MSEISSRLCRICHEKPLISCCSRVVRHFPNVLSMKTSSSANFWKCLKTRASAGAHLPSNRLPRIDHRANGIDSSMAHSVERNTSNQRCFLDCQMPTAHTVVFSQLSQSFESLLQFTLVGTLVIVLPIVTIQCGKKNPPCRQECRLCLRGATLKELLVLLCQNGHRGLAEREYCAVSRAANFRQGALYSRN